MPRVRVLRSYLERGAVRKAGEVVEVSASFARELIHTGKAEAYVEAPAPAPEKLTTETAAPLVKGKGKFNAG